MNNLEKLAKEVTEKDPYFGAIGDMPLDTDYQFGGEFKLPIPPKTWEDTKIEYNQDDVSKVSCTVFACMGAVTALTGYVFTHDEQKHLWNEAVKQGADPAVGWSGASAKDLVRNYCNSKGMDLMTITVDLTDVDKVAYILSQGYSIAYGHRGNKAFNQDIADGRLDNVEFGTTTYGHFLHMSKDVRHSDVVKNINSYPKTKKDKNIYYVEASKIAKLVKNGLFFRWAFVFVVKADFDNMNNIEPTISPWAISSVEKAKNKQYITKLTDLQDQVTPEMVEAILYRMQALTTKTGSLTKERLLVALDRLNLL